MNLTNRVFIFFFIFIIIACNKSFEPIKLENVEEIIYSNSFESEDDFEGWQGKTNFELRTDTPINGGIHSLYLRGACSQPVARYIFNLGQEECKLQIRFWGKSLFGIGSLYFYPIDSNYCEIIISDSVWTYYESPDTLIFPSNTEVRIDINVGGYWSFDEILFDKLEVLKID